MLAVNMISEGAHYRGVNTLIMFRRTNSYLVFTQQIGRIITLAKNENPNAIVFDLVNNIENIEYGNEEQDGKRIRSTTNIIKQLEKTMAFKSSQIIVADETKDIVKCIRKIKKCDISEWQQWEDCIIKRYYPSETAEECAHRINKKRKKHKYETCDLRTKYQVLKRAQLLDIVKWNEEIFTLEEEKELVDFYENFYKNKEKLEEKEVARQFEKALDEILKNHSVYAKQRRLFKILWIRYNGTWPKSQRVRYISLKYLFERWLTDPLSSAYLDV